MSNIKTKLISFLLLLLFLAPMAIIIEHNHEVDAHHCSIGFEDTEDDLSFSDSHEECFICEYEFTFLLTFKRDLESQTSSLDFDLLNNYTSILNSGTSSNYCSLRAPPLLVL